MGRKPPCQAHNLETRVRIPPPLLPRSSSGQGRPALYRVARVRIPSGVLGSSSIGRAAVSKAVYPGSSPGFPVRPWPIWKWLLLVVQANAGSNPAGRLVEVECLRGASAGRNRRPDCKSGASGEWFESTVPHSSLAQLAARPAVNREVPGSNPGWGAGVVAQSGRALA